LTEDSQEITSPEEAVSNQRIGRCCIDRLSRQP
jgi:hypothetical protein